MIRDAERAQAVRALLDPGQLESWTRQILVNSARQDPVNLKQIRDASGQLALPHPVRIRNTTLQAAMNAIAEESRNLEIADEDQLAELGEMFGATLADILLEGRKIVDEYRLPAKLPADSTKRRLGYVAAQMVPWMTGLYPTPADRQRGSGDSCISSILQAWATMNLIHGPILDFEDRLVEELENTDNAGKMPADLLHPPYRACYLRFRSITAAQAMSRAVGVDILRSDGCYVIEGVISPEIIRSRVGAGARFSMTPEITPDLPVRITGFMFIFDVEPGKPGPVLTQINLAWQPGNPVFERMTLEEMVNWNASRFWSAGNENSGELVRRHSELVNLVARMMMTLNCGLAPIVLENRHSRLMEQANRARGGKRGRLLRKASRAWDRIRVRVIDPGEHQGNRLETAGRRHVRPHWRRGHLRLQACGPGRQDRKVIWIRPVLVHAKDRRAAPPEARDYKIVL